MEYILDKDFFLSNINIGKGKELAFLLDKFDKSVLLDRRRFYAYFLATAELETAGTFLPVVEGYWIKANREKKLYDYYSHNNPYALKTIFPFGCNTEKTYEGRGYVQITHNFNYSKFYKLISDKYGVDVVEHPDQMLNSEIAFDCCELGMVKREFSFTGKILEDYFNNNRTDWVNARKIINGLNEAKRIGARAEYFYKYLRYNE